MTEKQKNRRNRFNTWEDDFILTDMNLIRADEELTPVPLNHLLDDEDAIDRLLIDTNFDAYDEHARTDALIVDDISLADEFGEKIDVRSSMIADAAIVNSVTGDTAKVVDVEEKNTDAIRHEPAMSAGIKSERASANFNEAGITRLNHNGLEHENIPQRLDYCEHNVKKTAGITYVSLAIGIVALLSTIAMAVIISGMKTEISKLTELVSILEEDMSSITEKNSDMKFNGKDTVLEQLNQKVSSLSKQLQEQSQSATVALKNKLAATGLKKAAINKSLGNLQTRLYALEQKKLTDATIKKASIKKQVQTKKAKNTPPAKEWSVNLVSYKEKDYAKNKAAKFIQKGVPVKVITVDANE